MIERLNEGKLSLVEVEPLTDKARELYEQLIALRFAAMQRMVKGDSEAEAATSAEPSVPFRLNHVLPGQTSLIDAIEAVTSVEPNEGVSVDELADQYERSAEATEDEVPDEKPREQTQEPEESLIVEVEHEVAQASDDHAKDVHASTVAEKPKMPPVAGRVLPKEKSAENTVAARLRRTPIEDLRKAIGLNQKFQFINDIFKGDSTAYNLLIDEVNSASSFDHAMTLLSASHPRFQTMDEEDAVVASFILLVERRFL